MRMDVAAELLERARMRVASLDVARTEETGRYEQSFLEATSGEPQRATWSTMARELSLSEVVLIGDFFTSAEPKWLASRLLSRLPSAGAALNFTPALETAPSSVKGASARLLRTLVRRSLPIHLFEPNDAETIAQKDDRATEALLRILSESNRRPLLVLVGELRLCDEGLLGRMERRLGSGKASAVYLDLEKPWLRLIQTAQQCRSVARLGSNRYCVITQSPLCKYLAHLAWSSGEEPIRAARLAATFNAYATRIRAAIVGRASAGPPALPSPTEPGGDNSYRGGDASNTLPSPTTAVTVFQPGDPRFLSAALHAGLSSEDVAFLEERMLAGESRILPDVGLAYFADLTKTHVAEEATHLVRASIGGAGYCDASREEAFFGVAVQEAAGYFGSKLIVHDRKPPLLPRDPAAVAARAHDGEALAHVVGYHLGERLFAGWAGGHVPKDIVSALFSQDLIEQGAARRLYFDLLAAAKVRQR